MSKAARRTHLRMVRLSQENREFQTLSDTIRCKQ